MIPHRNVLEFCHEIEQNIQVKLGLYKKNRNNFYNFMYTKFYSKIRNYHRTLFFGNYHNLDKSIDILCQNT